MLSDDGDANVLFRCLFTQINPDDRHSCLDVNECLQWDTCPQDCRNFKGGHECRCLFGYEDSGNNECAARGQSQQGTQGGVEAAH